jgi:hypothetical protein
MKPKIWIFSYLLLLFITSCRDEASSAGAKWLESSFYNVQTDTCTVLLSTILADSVATSGDTICQVGHYNSTTWGDIQASFYAEYDVPSVSLDENTTYRFDSITINLNPTGDYVGDTLTTQHIYMHKIKSNMALDKDGYLYNISSYPYEAEPFATLTFKNKPLMKKQRELRLPDEFGEELLSLMKNNSIYFRSQDYFRTYLKGIAFIPDASDKCINGFGVSSSSSSLCINLYYSKITSSISNLKTVFTPSSTLTFNKTVQDRSNSLLANIQSGSNNALSSNKTNHQAVIQGIIGNYIKIEFPHLNNLLLEGDIVSIESALLYLYPIDGTYDSDMPLPSSLTMYTMNDNNVAQESITDAYGTSVQDGSLTSNKSIPNGTYYTFDLTSFLQDNLGTFGMNRQTLMLMLPNEKFLTTLNGVTFGDQSRDTNDLELVVIYKTYNEQ